MPSIQELLSMLQNLEADPELREFTPLFEEIRNGIDDPDYDNIEKVLALFEKSANLFNCRKIAEGAYINANKYLPRKKWYELDDD